MVMNQNLLKNSVGQKVGCIMPKDVQPVLTEFFVTETYIIQARTQDEATDMVLENEFDDGIRSHNIDIQPNF